MLNMILAGAIAAGEEEDCRGGWVAEYLDAEIYVVEMQDIFILCRGFGPGGPIYSL